LVKHGELGSGGVGDTAGGILGVKEHKCSHGYQITAVGVLCAPFIDCCR
jgi:hypothetical protein